MPLDSHEISAFSNLWANYSSGKIILQASPLYENPKFKNIRMACDALVNFHPKEGQSEAVVILRKIVTENPKASFGYIFREF